MGLLTGMTVACALIDCLNGYSLSYGRVDSSARRERKNRRVDRFSKWYSEQGHSSGEEE